MTLTTQSPTAGRFPLAPPSLDALGLQVSSAGVVRRSYLLVRPIGFFVAYWVMAWYGLWPLALLCIAGMFVSGVAVLNDLIHQSIGLSRRQASVILPVIAALLLESGAAIRATHLQHHFGPPNEHDPESYIDAYNWPRLFRECPRYRYQLWVWAFRHRPEIRLSVALQATVHALTLACALAVPSASLRVLVGTLAAAGLAFPIISARGPQNGWGHGDPNFTVVRGTVVPRLLLGMVFHLEHHLYPTVPTYQLAELSRRLDPWLTANGVSRVRVW